MDNNELDSCMEQVLQEGAPLFKQLAPKRPILVPSSVIQNTQLSRHLLGVYVSLLYMYERGIEDIRELGMEENRFDTNIKELIELGLIKQETDGTLRLMEV